MKLIAVFLMTMLCGFTLSAQTYSISGTITDSKGEKIAAVTVFIDGTARATQTDAEGKYEITNVGSGNLTVVTSRLGYVSQRKPLLLSNRTAGGPDNRVVALNFTLQDKSITLNEVKIGDSSGRAKMLKTFKEKFLGFTTNGLSCKILNTELLEFTTVGSVLLATSSDFLIIENFGLGYRIKYLLKNFSFNNATHITAYDGDCIFKGGSYLDYRSFLLDGYWGWMQMGDRLPFSYAPE